MQDFQSDNEVLQVFLDKSDLQKSSLVERKLLEAFKTFMEESMVNCDHAVKVGGAVVSSEALIGMMNFDFKGSVIPGFILW
jgi:hypothetical protein